MADKEIRELLACAEVQTARERLDEYQAAEAAVAQYPDGETELSQLRETLTEMPGAVRMLLAAIDRAGAEAGEQPL